MAEFTHDVAPTDPPDASRPKSDRLDSWKEIAAYLNRDVTTVQRWEKREAMPVHRHLHDRQGSVYAYCAELDAWAKSRRLRLGEEAAPRRIDTEAEEKGSPEPPPPEQVNVQSHRTLRTRYWLVVGGVVVVLLAGAILVRGHLRSATPPKIKSLAVLPLNNLSGDTTQDYLADGMTEALIGRLSDIHDLRVVSRTSVMRFKENPPPIPEIARALGVDAIVEGSVIRQGNRIRVHAQLIRAATDAHFWSETYDHDLGDVLSLESEIARSIAAKVEATVTGEEHNRLIAARPIAPAVYENYLKGQFVLEKSNTRADIEESISCFQAAIKGDPAFAPAYLGLAAAYGQLSTPWGGGSPQQLNPKIISAVKKALEIDLGFKEAHLTLAQMEQMQWHWDKAEAEYKRALELEPNNADAQNGYAHWLLTQGRTDEALVWVQRAHTVDPNVVSINDVGWILFNARHYDEAFRELHDHLAIAPNDLATLWFLAFVQMAKHQPTEAVPLLEKAVLLSDRSPAIVGGLASAYARAGRRPQALQLVAELKEREQKGFVPAAAMINAYLGLAEYDQAFFWLEQGYKEQSQMLQFLKVHPYFDPIRNDPRFADLLHRVGLDQQR